MAALDALCLLGLGDNGDSYIRFSFNSLMILTGNHAFQRGGALYVHSAQHTVPCVRCFLRYEQGLEQGLGYAGILFQYNSAEHEGQSIFISGAENCFGDGKSSLIYFPPHN